MIISARFLSSASHISNSVLAYGFEAVFLGRSNVGKSSLINALCKQKNLAKSSSTPGKTRLINFFEVESKEEDIRQKFIFIDLPGFGYAKVSKSLKEEWDKSLDEFLRLRTSIKLFLHLVDARHTELELDEQIDEYLQSLLKEDQELIRIFTKSDKLNSSQRARLKNKYPNSILISNLKKEGLDSLENLIISKLGSFS